MTGYQEILTDPSYAGQVVVLTYPLVGNYGINPQDFESRRIQVAGLVVREHCETPSHGLSNSTLHEFLDSQGIPGIKGVDTRAITRRLRSQGVMMGLIYHEQPPGDPAPTLSQLSGAGEVAHESALSMLRDLPQYGDTDYVKGVTTGEPYRWPYCGDDPSYVPTSKGRILVADFGLKFNILRLLRDRGYEVVAVPATATAEDMMAMQPSGIVLSPGPGDPAMLGYMVDTARKLIGRVPIMGICLGHQIAARALGANTFKLKFGHRGGNHPVKDLADGRIYITAQNHGYAVRADSLPSGLEISHINLNDETVEGLSHRDLPVFTIQYHSEASPGPRDNEYLFDRFTQMMDNFDS
jgi:carbamoyl-phosphate synthase small subunit